MVDREKVIKGLEVCTSKPCYCTDCPYKANCSLDSQEVMEDALALLKEQEAIPVTQRELANMLFWCCGSCGVALTDGDKFCRNCGREVKWK